MSDFVAVLAVAVAIVGPLLFTLVVSDDAVKGTTVGVAVLAALANDNDSGDARVPAVVACTSRSDSSVVVVVVVVVVGVAGCILPRLFTVDLVSSVDACSAISVAGVRVTAAVVSVAEVCVPVEAIIGGLVAADADADVNDDNAEAAAAAATNTDDEAESKIVGNGQ